MTAPNQLYANDAQTTLAAGITSGSLALTVAAGTGTLFPNPNVTSEFFLVTLIDNATSSIKEIVRVTQRVDDIFTIVRGQEGTAPVAWSAGDFVKMLVTAGTMNNMIQIPQAQAQTFKFAQDTGTVNNLVIALSPAVTTRIPGLEVNIQAANANNGACTLNLGAGSIALVNPDGSALGAGAIVAGGVITVIDTGSGSYQLTSASQQFQSGAGLATTGDWKWRPTSEIIAGWVAANATTIGNASSNATQRANIDTAALFAWHWNNLSNTQCPVYTSAGVPTTRGANASADFAASKQIQVYDMRGQGIIGVDTMSGGATTRLTGVPTVTGNATTPGSVLGENLHQLVTSEIPAHIHNNFLSQTPHGHTVNAPTNNTSSDGGGGPGSLVSGFTTATIAAANANISLTNASAGGDGSHNNVQRSATGFFYIKL